MKQRKLLTTLVLVLALFGAFTLVSNAASTLQEIKAYINTGITVKMDGETQTFLDAKGTRVYPISYNGTTYLPIRAVAGLVGIDVDWDQATQSVLLGKSKSGVDLIDTYKAYDFKYDAPWNGAWQVQTVDGKTEDISGVTYSHWVELGTGMAGAKKGEVSASFNLLGKHDTLTFSYYSNNDATLTVLGDNGSVLGEYDIPGGAVAKTVTISLFKTSELKFQIETGEWHTGVKVFDARLDAK